LNQNNKGDYNKKKWDACKFFITLAITACGNDRQSAEEAQNSK